MVIVHKKILTKLSSFAKIKIRTEKNKTFVQIEKNTMCSLFGIIFF